MEKSTVLEKNDFECIFDRFEVLVDIEKQQTPALLLMVDFLSIFRITHF